MMGKADESATACCPQLAALIRARHVFRDPENGRYYTWIAFLPDQRELKRLPLRFCPCCGSELFSR
jgi:hypothetical protein